VTSKPALTIAFLEDAPQTAADALQGLKVDDAAAFLEIVPARLSAPVIVEMIPWTAARCLERLSPARAAAVLRQTTVQDSTTLLRLMQAESRDPIFEELPTALARRLKGSLQYPLSQVGAWTDTSVPVVRRANTVSDALSLLRECQVTTSHIFIESEADGRFLGTLSIKELLSGDTAVTLGQLPITQLEPISNRASLANVTFDAHWDDYLFLPVVNRRDAVIGGLSRNALRKGLHEQHVQTKAQPESMLGQLFTAFLITTAGLVELVLPDRTSAGLRSRGAANNGR
jgi:Mg/Co/Ni transporter MgtE